MSFSQLRVKINLVCASVAIATIAALTVFADSAHAAIVQTPSSSSGTALAFPTTSNTDLINAGQTSLSSAVVSPSLGAFPGTGINDGVYSNTAANNTFFQSPGNFPATATYTLDTTTNTLGYDVTSIGSFIGWQGNSSQAQANQTYTVEVSTVGSAAFSLLTTVNFTPFPATNGTNMESRVVITEDVTGVLASGVDQIRFTFADPGAGGAFPGTVVREIDVIGSATSPASASAPEPSSIALAVLATMAYFPCMRRRRRR